MKKLGRTKLPFNGLVLWKGLSMLDGQEIMAIATGLRRPSMNPKTGEMAQVWIIRADIHPKTAIDEALDFSICGNCPLRDPGGRICYVNQATPGQIFKVKDQYPEYVPEEHDRLFRGIGVRWGAYGDPALIPLEIVSHISALSDGSVGYTHQWRLPWAQEHRCLLMASCETEADRLHAKSLGWRTFRIVSDDLHRIKGVEAACQGGKKTQCKDCLLCSGTSNKAKADVVVGIHGNGKKYWN